MPSLDCGNYKITTANSADIAALVQMGDGVRNVLHAGEPR
jgi:hypothetical protein